MTRDNQLPFDEELTEIGHISSGDVLVFRNGRGEPVAVPSDVVTLAERAFRCYRLRLSGVSWADIADREYYPSAAAAAADVRRYTAEGAALVTERSLMEMMQLEVARLDALQAAIWDAAVRGSLPAIDMVRKLVMDRARLVGIDGEKLASSTAQQGRTVVVHSDDGSYTRDLRRAAGAL